MGKGASFPDLFVVDTSSDIIVFESAQVCHQTSGFEAREHKLPASGEVKFYGAILDVQIRPMIQSMCEN